MANNNEDEPSPPAPKPPEKKPSKRGRRHDKERAKNDKRRIKREEEKKKADAAEEEEVADAITTPSTSSTSPLSDAPYNSIPASEILLTPSQNESTAPKRNLPPSLDHDVTGNVISIPSPSHGQHTKKKQNNCNSPPDKRL